MSKHTLHPISYISTLFTFLKSWILPIVILLFLNFSEILHAFRKIMNGEFSIGMFNEIIVPFILAIIMTVFYLFTVIEIYRTRFYIEDRVFIHEEGIFSRATKEIDIDRIQSINIKQNIVERIAKAATLEITTPGQSIEVSSIKLAFAEALETQLMEMKQSTSKVDKEHRNIVIGETSQHNEDKILDETNEISTEVRLDGPTSDDHYVDHAQPSRTQKVDYSYKLSMKDLLLMGMTSGAIGTFLTLVFSALALFDDLINFGPIFEWIEVIEKSFGSHWIGIVVLGLIFTLIAFIFGTILNVIKYYDYTMEVRGDYVYISFGLFNKVTRNIPKSRVQGIYESQNLFRKFIGYTEFNVVITSEDMLNADDDSEGTKVMILPFIKKDEGLNIMQSLFTHYEFNSVRRCIPWRAFNRFIFWETIIFVVAMGVCYYFDLTWGYYVVGVLYIIGILSNVYDMRMSGYALGDNELSITDTGLFSISTNFIRYDKIMELDLSDNYFMRRRKLKNVNVKIAAGLLSHDADLYNAEADDALAIRNHFYRYHEEKGGVMREEIRS
ncbi:PH domain-containing protein [Abyssicoccus albus]|uniref:Putative membrane protein n=1 Tax=Abyssicoccus albus TaxID=1817405 RepID=A0A3N5BFA3_9BACL|nr:PH domain-containing protein [Abyssicoccus albus]RPF56406.1 putative membrane protein [Abyssicoccus albus]